MAIPLSEILSKLTPAQRARIDARAKELIEQENMRRRKPGKKSSANTIVKRKVSWKKAGDVAKPKA